MTQTTMSHPEVDKTVALTPELMRYARDQAGPLTAAQRELIDETVALGAIAEMRIPSEQGVLLTMLARLTSARTVLEVGTFTGYSTMALADGVGPGGVVFTCDVTDRWADIAAAAWRQAGVADRIEPLFGPAGETLRRFPEFPLFDMAFVDADKVGYLDYWEALVPRIRPGGLLIADNVLYQGEAASLTATGNARAIREFNEHVLADDRVESVLLTVADGLTLARKKTQRQRVTR
ncbi:O-methyltransferase [Amycolatopsis speibonae]|uniref:O-methyltransferase n=1 Tax=Amycolatopsis speibonae TaxID=1450224 RepID=A0ABV7P9N2_9PSEU